MKINELVRESHDRARRKGFYEVEPSIPERLCLIHSEVSEALEAYRDAALNTDVSPSGKPEGLPSELAEHEIRIKSDYNETRPAKHGRAKL